MHKNIRDHVIIESSNPAEETIGEGAIAAAYYSKYRLSGTVSSGLCSSIEKS